MSRPRPPSPDSKPTSKRQKLNDVLDIPTDVLDDAYVPDIFRPDSIADLAHSYDRSEPYKHAVLPALFEHPLLLRVATEVLRELAFAPKETDIYKVHQTGDLASLSYLDPAQRALFPTLLIVRDALYSPRFRAFLRAVTGCGALSGTKTDMSITSYRKGCHLLNHDDVIGSRRVSYILYLPLLSRSQVGWKEEYGGALELYPVKPSDTPGELPEPADAPTKRIPPKWGQFVFFEVQPGQSFHSVEEVVVGTDEDGIQRLSISGWFHKAQKGEPGYGEPSSDLTERLQSSLSQLTSSPSLPLLPYPSPPPSDPLPFIPIPILSPTDLIFLSDYLNPIYLQPRSLLLLARQFAQDCHLRLGDFLCAPLAEKLEQALREQDAEDGLGPVRPHRIPPHSAGVAPGSGFEVRGPPHKARYCVLSPSPDPPPSPGSLSPLAPAHTLLHTLQTTLFPSPAFRALLGALTSLLPLAHHVEARRFRPGLDYTLARAEEEETRLDVVLGLTPMAECEGKGKGRMREGQIGWEMMEWGGWDCYMAPHDGEEDPAVYRSYSSKKPAAQEQRPKPGTNGNGNGHTNGVAPPVAEKKATQERYVPPDEVVAVDRYVPPDDVEGPGLGSDRYVPPDDVVALDSYVPTPEDADSPPPFIFVPVQGCAPPLSPPPPPESDNTGGKWYVPPADIETAVYQNAILADDYSDYSDYSSSSRTDSDDSDEGSEAGGAELTNPAVWNGLLIVLRDPKLMRFVKYVSAAATGSRWDICGEWEVGRVESDDGDVDE